MTSTELRKALRDRVADLAAADGVSGDRTTWDALDRLDEAEDQIARCRVILGYTGADPLQVVLRRRLQVTADELSQAKAKADALSGQLQGALRMLGDARRDRDAALSNLRIANASTPRPTTMDLVSIAAITAAALFLGCCVVWLVVVG